MRPICVFSFFFFKTLDFSDVVNIEILFKYSRAHVLRTYSLRARKKKIYRESHHNWPTPLLRNNVKGPRKMLLYILSSSWDLQLYLWSTLVISLHLDRIFLSLSWEPFANWYDSMRPHYFIFFLFPQNLQPLLQRSARTVLPLHIVRWLRVLATVVIRFTRMLAVKLARQLRAISVLMKSHH